MLSAIALRRKAGIHEFTDEFVRSAPVQQMMARCENDSRPGDRGAGFEKIRSTVEVDLDDGRTLVQAADERYRGGPDRPFTREELHEKFTECAELVLPRSRRSPRRCARSNRWRRSGDITTLVTRPGHATARPVGARGRSMNLAWISIAALVLAVTLSCTTTINVGVLSMALALLVGVYLGGMSPDGGARRISDGAARHARRRDAALQHRRGQRHAGAGDGARRAPLPRARGPAADHVLRPRPRHRDDRRRRHARRARCWRRPRWPWPRRAGIPLLLMAIMAGNGALAGTLSPFAPTGIVAHGVMARIGLGGVEWQTFAYNALAHTIVGVRRVPAARRAGACSSGAIATPSRPTEPDDRAPWSTRHWLTLAGIVALIVASPASA